MDNYKELNKKLKKAALDIIREYSDCETKVTVGFNEDTKEALITFILPWSTEAFNDQLDKLF